MNKQKIIDGIKWAITGGLACLGFIVIILEIFFE